LLLFYKVEEKMIFVPRSKPTEALLKIMAIALTKAKTYYSLPTEQRNQHVFRYQEFLSGAARQDIIRALQSTFHHKCAFCETQMRSHYHDILLFRPASGVAEANGEYLRDHYWAQAFEWENMYLACPSCQQHKANRFPVVGERAPADSDRQTLLRESPLLLDPCMDQPDQHLAFSIDGIVTPANNSHRGLATINILKLNRQELSDQA
jgi:uncharacterized protein (TIGR02646 family)